MQVTSWHRLPQAFGYKKRYQAEQGSLFARQPEKEMRLSLFLCLKIFPAFREGQEATASAQ